MKKTTKKTIKPAFIADITWCENTIDVAFAFGIAKQHANLPLSEDNLNAICAAVIDQFTDALHEAEVITKCGNTIVPMFQPVYITEKPKKKNIFKRFWNWIIGKKN